MSGKCCCGTEKCQEFKELDPILDKYAKVPGSLITILQKTQDIYGYISIDAMNYISQATGIKTAKIYGVATFYAQFALQPKGKFRISVCLGTACYVKGSGKIYEKLQEVLNLKEGECTPDGKFSLESCRCVGACGLAPVMMINDDVHGRLVPDDVEKILAQYN